MLSLWLRGFSQGKTCSEFPIGVTVSVCGCFFCRPMWFFYKFSFEKKIFDLNGSNLVKQRQISLNWKNLLMMSTEVISLSIYSWNRQQEINWHPPRQSAFFISSWLWTWVSPAPHPAALHGWNVGWQASLLIVSVPLRPQSWRGVKALRSEQVTSQVEVISPSKIQIRLMPPPKPTTQHNRWTQWCNRANELIHVEEKSD